MVIAPFKKRKHVHTDASHKLMTHHCMVKEELDFDAILETGNGTEELQAVMDALAVRRHRNTYQMTPG